MKLLSKRVLFVGFSGILLAAGLALWKYDALKLEYDWYRLQSVSEIDPKLAINFASRGQVGLDRILNALKSQESSKRQAAGRILKAVLPVWGEQPEMADQLISCISEIHSVCPEESQKIIQDLLPELLRTKYVVALDPWKKGDAVLRKEVVSAVRHKVPEHPELVLPRLKDSEKEVRQMALLLVGPGSETGRDCLDTESLIPFLHDIDPEISAICESCLKTRGLDEEMIRLARRISHPDPRERLDLLLDLRRDRELDVRWLERLSRDSNAAVRLGTVRVAAERNVSEFAERLQQMRKTDPDGTVRQMAGYYEQFLSVSQH
jgi:hypothetical protein